MAVWGDMCVCSVISDSLNPWIVARHVPLSMRFSRQEYWRGLPFPPPGDLPDPGVEPMSPMSPVLAGRFFTTEPPGNPSSGWGGGVSNSFFFSNFFWINFFSFYINFKGCAPSTVIIGYQLYLHVQCTFIAYLTPVVCTSHFPPLYCPPPQ